MSQNSDSLETSFLNPQGVAPETRPLWRRVLDAVPPGAAMTSGELRRATGIADNGRMQWLLRKLMLAGLLARVPDPEYVPGAPRVNGEPLKAQWLYRRATVAERRDALAAVRRAKKMSRVW